MSQESWLVSVVFRDKYRSKTGWSKAYSYLHTASIAIDSLVVVPAGDFPQCARVVASHPVVTTKLTEGLSYSNVITVLPLQVAGKASAT